MKFGYALPFSFLLTCSPVLADCYSAESFKASLSTLLFGDRDSIRCDDNNNESQSFNWMDEFYFSQSASDDLFRVRALQRLNNSVDNFSNSTQGGSLQLDSFSNVTSESSGKSSIEVLDGYLVVE